MSIAFAPNLPLDVDAIGALFESERDQNLVWPAATWPFDRAQWFDALDPALGHRSYFVTIAGERAGHIALRAAPPGHAADRLVSYVYLRAAHRGRGHAGAMLAFVEAVARREHASVLGLVVRTYNPVARHCYERAGFAEIARDGTLVTMRKHLVPGRP